MSRLFGNRSYSESTCNTILIRNSSNYRNYVDFRRSTSDGHPMPTGTCLFPTCCCSIMFRLVCCFGYSWCVSRLLRHGPGPDWQWPTKDVSNIHVWTRFEFFSDYINKKNNHMLLLRSCCFWVGIGCTNGTLNTLPTCQNLNVCPQENNNMCAFDKMFVWVENGCTGGTLNTLLTRQDLNVFPRFEPGSQGYKN